MVKVKRPFLLIGLITDIVALGLTLLISFFVEGILYFSFSDIYSYLVILLIILFVLGIVFSSIGLTVTYKDFSFFKQKRKFIIFTIIIVFLSILYSILFMLNDYSEPGFYIFICSTISFIFTIIGYVKAMRNIQTPQLIKRKSEIFDDALQKIEKLKKLRDQRIISDKDFDELKRKQLDILERE